MSSVAHLHDGELVDAPPQIPEGEYQAIYVRHETTYIFTTPKVFVHFRLSGGEYDGLRLYGAYRVDSLKGKPRKGGAFKLRHSYRLYRQLVTVTGSKERPDRVSLSKLKSGLLKVRVRTVTRDSRQKSLPPPLQYSIVDAILSLEAGSCE